MYRFLRKIIFFDNSYDLLLQHEFIATGIYIMLIFILASVILNPAYDGFL